MTRFTLPNPTLTLSDLWQVYQLGVGWVVADFEVEWVVAGFEEGGEACPHLPPAGPAPCVRFVLVTDWGSCEERAVLTPSDGLVFLARPRS